MTYLETILADAPAGYWRLGETAGTVAADSSGNGHPGTYIGSYTLNAPSLVPADPNPALALAGSSKNGITIAGLAQPARMSVEAWVKLAATQTSFARLYACGAAYDVFFDAARKIILYLNFVEGGSGNIDTGVTVPALTPAHVVATWDGTAVRIFLNGAQVYSNTAFAGRTLPGVGATTQLKAFGCIESTAGADLTGTIDECAVYAVALTAAQVRAHYLAAFPGYAARIMADAPLGYWRLNEPSGLTAADLAGGKNGTIAGGVTLAQPGAVPGDTAMSFNGLTGRVATTLGFPTAQCSAEAWVFRTGGGQGTFPRLLTDAASNSFPFELAITSGTLQFFLQAQGSVWTSSGISIPLNTWVHIVATWDGVVYRIYKDGALAYTNSSFPPGPLVAGATVSWANDNGVTNNAIQATLDEVAIYSYALTPAQVTAHYQARALPFSFGTYPYRVIQDGASNYWRLNETNAGYSAAVLALSPLAYWRFEETGGNRFKDASGNNHTLYSGQSGAAGANVAGVTYRRPAPLRDGSAGLTTINTQGLGCFPITLTVSPAASSQAPKGTLTITWAGIPAAFVSAINFVAIARKGNEANQIGWKYIPATASGSMTMAVDENVAGPPYPVGGEAASDYRITLYYNNSWMVLAEIEGFTLMPNPPAGGTLSSPSPVPLAVGATCTFECWLTVRSMPATNRSVIIETVDGGLYLYATGGNTCVSLYFAGADHLSTPLALNTPYHVAAVCAAGAVTIYLNGVAAGTFAGWTGLGLANVINQVPTGGQYFNGDIDELAIYGTALSAATVAAHAAFWTPVAVDSIGGKNGAISGGVALNQPGALGSGDKAMVFDGVNGKIVTAANVPFTVPFTIETWVRVAALGPYNVLFSTRMLSGTLARFAIIIYPTGTLNINWQYPNDTPAQVFVGSTTVPFVAGQWYHVTVVFNALSIALYVNGASVPVDLPGPFATALVGSATPLTIATDSPFTPNWLNGSLDEAAIYPFALTPAQIAAHYQAGKAGPPLAGIPWWVQIGSEVLLGSV